MFDASLVFGSVELKELHKFEDGVCKCYGYSIHRDRAGKEVSRTEPELISILSSSKGAV